MIEGVSWMLPRQFRYLFVRILIHCHPKEPYVLWEEFKSAMSEDYARNYDLLQSQKMAYDDIIRLLYEQDYHNFNVADMDAMQPIINEITSITPEEHLEIGNRQYNMMNETQKKIVDEILDSLDNNRNQRCFFVDGPGGSGKTFIYNTLYHLIKGRKLNVNTMAFTGIAATLLPEGKTVHKTLGLPVPLFADSSSSIKAQSEQGQTLKNVDVFIWDEAPMAPQYALEIMDRLLKDIMQSNSLFGNKIVVLGGDFRQLLPIKENGTKTEIINLSIKFSSLWRHFRKFALTKNMRVLPEELEFAKFVLNVGDGKLNDNHDNIVIPPCLLSDSNADIVEDIYGEAVRNQDFRKISTRAILSARNIDVDAINKKVVTLLDPSTEKIFTSIDSVDISDDNGEIAATILPEYSHTLSPPSLPPLELCLRKHSVIMLIRNLNINEGLCNGTRLLVLDFTEHLLKCEILTGDHSGIITFISQFCVKMSIHSISHEDSYLLNTPLL